MNFEDIKAGMTVRISRLMCEKTQKHFGLTDDMKKLQGKEFKISSTIKERNIVRINGFSWHAEDLMSMSEIISKEKRKKIKPVLFDEELLWIE